VVQFGLFDSPLALILVYRPSGAVLHLALDRYFKSIPYELRNCALVDGATRLQILRRITLPLAVPGLISAGIFSFYAIVNEFITHCIHPEQRQQDRAGRDPDRTGFRDVYSGER